MEKCKPKPWPLFLRVTCRVSAVLLESLAGRRVSLTNSITAVGWGVVGGGGERYIFAYHCIILPVRECYAMVTIEICGGLTIIIVTSLQQSAVSGSGGLFVLI